MRLLPTSFPAEREGELRLEEFFGDRIPPYAILSHTWAEAQQEIQFGDVQHGSYQHKSGVAKVCGALKQARDDGHKYVWIDSICIDKSSSSELSEAINSMFRWYRNSEMCYVYLSDVSTPVTAIEELHAGSEFCLSRWWTRGWTLQELIAPRFVNFFTSSWQLIGNRAMLQKPITAITKIEREHLLGLQDLSSASIAKRMSWAASRTTSREEDMAYCLLGLFSVNMPMLYGEGQQAFHRLQDEIMKMIDDHTIFAWRAERSVKTHGLLADSPRAFAASSECTPCASMKAVPFEMTNMGLRIELPLVPIVPIELDDRSSEPTFDALLACTMSTNRDKFLAIQVRALPGEANQWTRIECSEFHYRDDFVWPIQLYVPQPFPGQESMWSSRPSSGHETTRLRSFTTDNPSLSGTFSHLYIWRIAPEESAPQIESSGAFRQFDHGDLPARDELYKTRGRSPEHNENPFCIVGAARGRAYGWFILQRVSNATELMIIIGRHMTGQLGFGVLWCLQNQSGRVPVEKDLCPLQPAGTWMDVEVYYDSTSDDLPSWSKSNLEKRMAANRVRRVPLRRAKVDLGANVQGRFCEVSVQLA